MKKRITIKMLFNVCLFLGVLGAIIGVLGAIFALFGTLKNVIW